MTRWRKFWAILALILPLIITGLMATKAYDDQKSYPLIKVKIAGYDPRDLLRGHYLRYQFDWNWEENQPNETACGDASNHDNTCCLCLSGDKIDPKGHLVSCQNPEVEQCPAVLEGALHSQDQFYIGHDQYFVPESHALSLEQLLRDDKIAFRIGLSVRPNGQSVVENLYIDDHTLVEYLRLYGPDIKPKN